MNSVTPEFTLISILEKMSPQASASISGNHDHPNLNGTVRFYPAPYGGVLITAELFHLPYASLKNDTGFYGMHIHETGDCTPPFDKSGMHFNPENLPHPDHAGDLLPILGNQGYAWSAFYDTRFSIEEIIGRSVIIHEKRDDFTTQPSGDSGTKIGCGIIRSSDTK